LVNLRLKQIIINNYGLWVPLNYLELDYLGDSTSLGLYLAAGILSGQYPVVDDMIV
jgi:hypothetical protein